MLVALFNRIENIGLGVARGARIFFSEVSTFYISGKPQSRSLLFFGRLSPSSTTSDF